MSCGKGQLPTLLGLMSDKRKAVTLAVLQVYVHAFLQMDQQLAEAEKSLGGLPPAQRASTTQTRCAPPNDGAHLWSTEFQ